MPNEYTQAVDDEPIIEVEDDDGFVEVELDEEEVAPVPPKAEKQPEKKPEGDLTVALRKEREKRREYEAQLRQAKDLLTQFATGKTAQQDKQPDPIADVLSQLEGDDYDPKIIAAIKALGAKVSQMSGKSNDDTVLELRIQQLENKYPDAADYRDEIASLVKAGLTPEKAYYAAAGPNLTSRSRDDVLREAELQQIAERTSTPRVAGEGNGAPTDMKQRATVKVKKSDKAYLDGEGISIGQHERVSKKLEDGISMEELLSTFGKAGSKKG